MKETEHQRRRRERAEARAEKLRRKADAAHEQSRKALDQIPMGQPVLVGHHSEARHRRDLERSNRAMAKAADLHRQAEHAAHGASRSGASISGDDPEAIAALTAKLEKQEKKREEIKAYNRKARKAGEEPLPSYAGHHPRRVGHGRGAHGRARAPEGRRMTTTILCAAGDHEVPVHDDGTPGACLRCDPVPVATLELDDGEGSGCDGTCVPQCRWCLSGHNCPEDCTDLGGDCPYDDLAVGASG